MLTQLNCLLALAALTLAGAAHADPLPPGDNPAFLPAPAASGIPVAVIDSGADYNHDLIRPHLWTNPDPGRDGDVHGWDFGDGDAFPYDFIPPRPPEPACDSHKDGFRCFQRRIGYLGGELLNLIRPGAAGHGTHCAGIAARESAGKAVIMPLRIEYASKEWISQAVAAIEYAAAHGARVVSMSFGAYPDQLSAAQRSEMEDLRAAMASHRDMLFVIAAGNENRDMSRERERILPGTYKLENEITVGAVDKTGALASFSNVGEGLVDVYAPGVDIQSSWPGNQLRVESGTSMATPFIAGLAARILADNPDLDGAALKDQVLKLAHPHEVTFTKTDNASTEVPDGTVEKLTVPEILE